MLLSAGNFGQFSRCGTRTTPDGDHARLASVLPLQRLSHATVTESPFASPQIRFLPMGRNATRGTSLTCCEDGTLLTNRVTRSRDQSTPIRAVLSSANRI